jgi:hypothetical protein
LGWAAEVKSGSSFVDVIQIHDRRSLDYEVGSKNLPTETAGRLKGE